jgi:lipopolysaccharide biosynthesis glycosyltransferase
VSNSPFQSIWIGYDPREVSAFVVAVHSIRRFDRHVPVKGIVLDRLKKEGLYYRPTHKVKTEGPDGRAAWQIIDEISNAPNSTEFSISRFLVPKLARTGWALYVDCDVMFRRNVNELFAQADSSKAVMVVKHDYSQREGLLKMDGQRQTVYRRKNWSSVILFNCDHSANNRLTVEYVNSARGLALHQFDWLEDDQIGELTPEWNYCVGHSELNGKQPALVHFTDGTPDMPGYDEQEYAHEWLEMKPYAARAL